MKSIVIIFFLPLTVFAAPIISKKWNQLECIKSFLPNEVRCETKWTARLQQKRQDHTIIVRCTATAVDERNRRKELTIRDGRVAYDPSIHGEC